jgi:hypothetical protein
MLSQVRGDVEGSNTLLIGVPAVIGRDPIEADPIPFQHMARIQDRKIFQHYGISLS